jgi:exopolysaccharide biosynthesis operon protein EpsL
MSGLCTRTGKLALVCGFWVGSFAGAALADEFDTFNVQAATTFVHDSNLFRLPAGSDPNVVLRAPSRADSLNVSSLGVTLNKPYSLQRFELGASFVDYRYKNFTFLNFSAFNYNGAWRWSVTPRLRGNATATRSETLNTFVDFRSFIRNVRTETNNRFDAEYEVDGVWRVLGGVGESEVKNEQIFLAQQNFRNRSAEGGLKYAFPSGSYASAIVRSNKGEYTQLAQPVVASLFDNRYEQRDVEARLFWSYSGKSSMDFRATYIDRKHATFAQRDFGGVTGNATVNWGITGKTRLVGSASRELGTFVQASSSYTRLDKLSIGPVWEVTPKVVARARYETSTRDFLGPVANTAQNDRSDKLRTLYAGADWQPYRWVTMSVSLQNDTRSSNLPGLDFKSTTGTLSAQVTF